MPDGTRSRFHLSKPVWTLHFKEIVFVFELSPPNNSQYDLYIAQQAADADRQLEVTIANAYRDAQKVKGEGDAQAARIYAEAFGRDPQFAQFYRSLDAYKASFSSKSDVMVLDPAGSEFFKTFRSGGTGAGAAAPRK